MKLSDGTLRRLLLRLESIADIMSLEELLKSVPKDEYGESYQAHILEIYKLYVQSADNISARRQAANSFFLSVNTVIIGAVGFIADGNGSFGWAVSLAGIVICITWYRSVRAYKGLNSGKFKVIDEIESNLPIAVFKAEWEAVGRGKDSKLYLPFTRIEVWVPRIFIALHASILLISFPWSELVKVFCG